MASTLIENVLKRNKELKTKKNPYLEQFQRVGEFVHTRKQEFESEHSEGDFLTDELFDGSGPKAAKTAASSILSMLWPNSVRRFRLSMPRDMEDTEEHKKYYEFVTEKNLDVLDNPKGGLPTSLDEYMFDELTFGTAGIDIMPDPLTKVRYTPWGVKHMSIAEGKGGFVDTVYIENEQTVQRIVMEYGLDKVSEKVREAFEKKRFDEKEKILVAIEPRLLRNPRGLGNRDMPFQSIHIEIKQKHMLRESGFEEFPMVIGRFWKILKEVYGRSPAMDALPDIQQINVVREGVDIGLEKTLDPPLVVVHDSILGNGIIDTSAGGLTVINVSGRAGERNPIEPLFTVGDVRPAENRIENLQETIANHFFIDRLLDFNNETRMTLGEAQIRNRLRNATLGTIFSRQIAEVFSPLIERTFNILLAQNELGVVRGSVEEQVIREFENKEPMIIPDEIARRMQAGEDVFKIEYFTPALRIMQAEEVEGIFRTLEQAAIMAAVVPDIMDNIDSDEAIRRISNLLGAPSEILRPRAKVEEIRDNRQAQLEAQQEQEQLMASAEVARNVGQSGLVPTQRPQEAA